jgi:hypothetical protein
MACRARRDIALEIVGKTQSYLQDTILGVAVPLAREGLNARVFDEHVRDLAVRQSRDYASFWPTSWPTKSDTSCCAAPSTAGAG